MKMNVGESLGNKSIPMATKIISHVMASWRFSLFAGESGKFGSSTLLKIIIFIKSGNLLGNILGGVANI